MTVMDDTIQYRRLRAPANDREVLVVPSADGIESLFTANRDRRTQLHGGGTRGCWAEYDCQGRRLGDLIDQARRGFVTAAVAYTKSYRDVGIEADTLAESYPIFLAGHQPDLFHVGVWAKNFAIDRLAKAYSGLAINLLIDSDVPKSNHLNVPAGTVQSPTLQDIKMAERAERVPYEEWTVTSADVFESFGHRAIAALEPLVADPLMRTFWPQVLERSRAEPRIGACLSQARHRLEGQWGSDTLELPQSRICNGEPFFWFASHLLAQLPRLHDIYNASAGEYRRVHRLRSAAHPVPNLAAQEDWLEAPFWIWTNQDPRRRRLICRSRGDELLLSDGQGLELPLSLTPDGDAETAVNQLAEAAASGIKIRTRALITTLFARLLCGDLFVHGIGGAKYDQLTDLLIQRFFQFDPPAYLALSGTLKLPIVRPPVTEMDLHSVNARLRDLQFNPDRYVAAESVVSDGTECRELVENKRHWVKTPRTIDNAKTRHQEIHRCNEALQVFVTDKARQLRSEREGIIRRLRAEAILSARDYAFCLYPETLLSDYLLDILPQSL